MQLIFSELLDSTLAFVAHLARFAWVVVVVRERLIDVGHVEVVPVSDRFGIRLVPRRGRTADGR